jgi:hypothetical protein
MTLGKASSIVQKSATAVTILSLFVRNAASLDVLFNAGGDTGDVVGPSKHGRS